MKVWYADELFHEQPNEPNNSVPVYEKSVADAVIAELREDAKDAGVAYSGEASEKYTHQVVYQNGISVAHLNTKDEQIAEAVILLDAAVCPCCDKSGAYYDWKGNVHQCQWCDEVSKLKAKQGE